MKEKKPTENQKKKVNDFLERIDIIFSVNNYTKKVKFIEKNIEDDERDITADITTDHKYRRLVIKIYPYFWTLTKKEQRKCLVHELCHTITQASKDASIKLINGKLITVDAMNDINENATSQIENIINDFLNSDMEWAIKAYKNYLK